jgi:hypothetical protein
LAGVLGLAERVLRAEARPGAPAAFAAAVVASIRTVPSARLVGERYLKLYPDEADCGYLGEHLWRALRTPSEPLAADEIAQRLRARSVADFRDGDTVKIDGCWASRAELRLCALVAMMAGRA